MENRVPKGGAEGGGWGLVPVRIAQSFEKDIVNMRLPFFKIQET